MTVTLRRLISAVALTVAVAGCNAAPASPGTSPASRAAPSGATAAPAPSSSVPSPSPAPPDPWQTANVALPSDVTSAPSLEPGYQCHPCHELAENQLFGVTPWATGLLAVGIQEPPAQAVAFSSSDGFNWAPIKGFTNQAGAAVATASNGSRTVIVGNDPAGAVAWAWDGASWQRAPTQASLLVPYAAGAMESVAAFGSGFVSGGYRDDPVHDAPAAAVWRSDDGLTWQADDDHGVFAGGRIWGIAATADAIVAVGTSGDPNYGPAGAWRWTPAAGWQAARIGPDTGGAMRAVTATAAGFVAVGLNGQDAGAMVWRSSDGLTWTAEADQPAFHYSLMPVRMQSVVAGPFGLVAAGWRSDVSKGSAVTWTSTDGTTWQGPTWENPFSGGQIRGLAVLGGSVVAVGRTGYPDWNQATIWLSQAP